MLVVHVDRERPVERVRGAGRLDQQPVGEQLVDGDPEAGEEAPEEAPDDVDVGLARREQIASSRVESKR